MVPTYVGHLLRTEIEIAQIELRASNIIFQLDNTKWGILLTNCRVKTLWKLCRNRMIHIRCWDFKPPL